MKITPWSVFLGLTRLLSITSSLRGVYGKTQNEPNIYDMLNGIHNPFNNIDFVSDDKIPDYDNFHQFEKDVSETKYPNSEKMHPKRQKSQQAKKESNIRKKTFKDEIVENKGKFFSAINKGSIHDLEKIKSIDINAIDNNGHTALHIAAKKQYHHLVDYLLRKDIDVNIVDNLGRSAIFYATANKNNNMIKSIFPKVSNVDHADENRVTVLLIASYHQNHDLVNLFLSKNPNTNWQDNYGKTALHYAAHLSDNELIKLLLQAGGDCSVADNEGKTPLDIAVELENSDMTKMIELHNEQQRSDISLFESNSKNPDNSWVGYLFNEAKPKSKTNQL